MKKSIAIIGEGETEWFYFDSLRVTCRYPFRLAPDLKSENIVTIQFRPSCNQTKNPEVIPGIFCIGMAEVV